jgi:uncharacterized protein YndB with AHSA1/START domain
MSRDSQPAELDVSPPGEIVPDGEHATLIFRRRLPHPPEVVWHAITDPEQIRQWFATEARIDGWKGGTVDLVTGPNRVHGTGRILEWVPPRVYEYEWNVEPNSYLPTGEASVVRWELTPSGAGTLLVLSHRRLTRSTATIFRRGLRTFLDRLAALLEGQTLPPWMG